MTLYDECPAPTYILTDRQIIVLQCCADGMKETEIARAIGITLHTVKEHKQEIRRALGTRNVTQAVYVAVRMRLIG